MRRAICRIAIAVTALVGLGACPGSSQPAGPDAGPDLPPELTADEFEAAMGDYINALCDFKNRCGVLDDAQLSDCKASCGSFSYPPDSYNLPQLYPCKSTYGKSPESASVHEGYLVALRAPMESCIGTLKSLQCSALAQKDVVDGCSVGKFFVANATKGGPCLIGPDCKDTLYCTGKGCTAHCSDNYGTQKPGESCDHYSCDYSLGYCDYNTPAFCRTYLATGQSCGTEQCNSNKDFCDWNTHLCTGYLDLGQSCTTGSHYGCGDKAFCKMPSGSTYGTCTAPLVEGAQCTANDHCGTYHDDTGDHSLYCDSTPGKCLRHELAIGDKCYTAQYCQGYAAYCKDGTATIQGVCSVPTYVKLNGSCDVQAPFNRVCELGLWCDPVTTTCKALSAIGGVCSGSEGCKEFVDCVGTTCTARPPVAQKCSAAGTHCAASNFCEDTSKVCTPPRANGAACWLSEECASNYCSNGTCIAACQ